MGGLGFFLYRTPAFGRVEYTILSKYTQSRGQSLRARDTGCREDVDHIVHVKQSAGSVQAVTVPLEARSTAFPRLEQFPDRQPGEPAEKGP